MGQLYTILSAEEGRTYTGKYGDMVVWNVTLENARPENGAGSFELHKKPGNTPQPGDTIEVKRFAPGEHQGNPHVRIFVESPQGAGAGAGTSSTGGGGGGTRWTPEKERSVVRQHSQEMALRFIAATKGFDELDPTEDADVGFVLNSVVRRVTDWFAADATPEGNGAAVVAPPNGGGGEVPADTSGLAPAPAGVGDDIPFHHRPVPDFESRRRDLFIRFPQV